MDLIANRIVSDIGAFPDGWTIAPLSRFWSVTDCKHITADFVRDGYPVVSIMEIQDGIVNVTNANYTTSNDYRQLTEGGRKPRPGDLILSRNATVGEVARVTEASPLFAMGQDVCLLRKIAPEYSTTYLQSLFHFSIIKRQFADAMVGSTFKRINVGQIKTLLVPMPQPGEQQAIAEALEDAEAYIESLEQLLAKKRDVKQGAMQELLTAKRRLSGFSGEWATKILGEIAVASKGVQLDSASVSEYGTVPHLNGGVTASGYTDTSNSPGNMIAISEGGNSCGFVQMMTQAFWCGGHCYAVRPINIDNRFLYYALKSQEKVIMRLRVGSGLPNIQKTALLHFGLRLPMDRNEQVAIATVLSDMDFELLALEAKLSKARDVKQGMMQQLLTGKIRLV